MDRSDYMKVEGLGRVMYEHLKGQPTALALTAAQEVLCCALLNSQPDPRKLDLQMLAEGLTQGILRDIEARLQFLKEHPEVKPWDVDWFPEK